MTRVPIDAAARETAVTGHASYIVQAPAGSGKTELLVQRFLRLLGEVEQPESIIAITFTRKAAAEMRNRIVDAMVYARDNAKPSDPHKAFTWNLATRALRQDQQKQWSLIAAPRRLRVQTIDSLCSEIVRQLPLLTDMGAMPDVVDDATELYLTAAENALDLTDDEHGKDVATLLAHLEGDLERAARMLRNMLAAREQWLPHLSGQVTHSRRHFELELAELVSAQLKVCSAALPRDLLNEMIQITTECAANLDTVAPNHELEALRLPMQVHELERKHWQALDQMFLTRAKSFTVRAKFDRRIGVFPSSAGNESTLKERALATAKRLQDLADGPTALRRAAKLPQPQYTDSEWHVLNALLRLLKLAAAHLGVEFSTRVLTDFAELQARATIGLGHPDAPSELALALDYRLAHVLVDEFQDTSRAQVQLLTQLTAGWEPDDGRTLFIVGDPMQSIYRFRQAEVGNFLRAKQFGIGEVPLVPLRLSANFRSAKQIVDWVNKTFAQVFPPIDNAERGHIAYAESDAFNALAPQAGVFVHPYISHEHGDTIAEEVAKIGDIIRTAVHERAEASIAVLVRARSHLLELLPYLKRAGIAFQAVEAESLVGRQTVHDIHAVFRVLARPTDKVAWLTVLRAPSCGLKLADLNTLFDGQAAASTTWLELLGDPVRFVAPAAMSDSGERRLRRVQRAVYDARQVFGRAPLHIVVERLWRALGGPACLTSASDQDDVRAYLDCLRREQHAGSLIDSARFERRLDKLFAPANTESTNAVQVMTMHKAKGLEFDTVILPSLGRRPPPRSKPLIAWDERQHADGRTSLLVAPVSVDERDSGLFSLIYDQDRALEEQESARLLYVGATRARRVLHLLGATGWSDSEDAPRRPANGSLLARLWPVVADDFSENATENSGPNADATPTEIPQLRRVTDAWVEAASVRTIFASHDDAQTGEETPDLPEALPELEFDWAGETARHTGTLVHRWLERIANDGVENWNTSRLTQIKHSFGPALANLGVVPELLAEASKRVEHALTNALQDETGRWLLKRHARGAAELALSTVRDGTVAAFVVDRTFIDETGVRWIVDYKTGSHEGGDVAAFLASEQERYQTQLEGYARLLRAFEQRETRLALYFPLMKELRAWNAPQADTTL